MSNGLEACDLTVRNDREDAVLDGVNLRVQPGTMVAVRGPSGSGKSTLIHAVLGALPPGLHRHRGTVTWNDAGIPSGAAARRWRRREVGVCAQESGASLHPHRSVLELMLENVPVSQEAEDRATRLLAELGLDASLFERLPSQLSGGQAQRVALARALLSRPRLLVVDEPTRGLDATAATAVHAQLLAARDANSAVLVVTHDDRLARIADETVSLRSVSRTAGASDAGLPSQRRPRNAGEARLEISDLVLAQPEGGARVLRVDRLRIGAGERVAVLGPSGSGKTTLLRTLAGLHTPESGGMSLDDAPLGAAHDRAPAIRAAVQMVGQNPYRELNPAHRARTAVRRPLRVLRRHSRAASARIAEQSLAELGLDANLTRRHPSALSGGQRQRVALARALAVSPSLLLADEPTSALDADTARAIMTHIDAACAEGLAVLLATHDEELADWADRRLLIVDDQLLEEIRPG